MLPRLSTFVCLTVLAMLLAAAPAAAGLPLLSERVDPSMLPLPFGIGVTVYGQTQPYKLDRLNVQVQGFDIPNADSIKIDNSLSEQDAKFDVWLFPFLNLFGLVGNLDGNTSVDLSHAHCPWPWERSTSATAARFGGPARRSPAAPTAGSAR